MTRPVSILVAALGGEGGGVLTQWLVEAALHAGHPVQSTSIPGVAQRTGATTYYVEIFPVAREALGGREPVFALAPSAGRVDLVVASEALEAVRVAQAGFIDAGRTTVLASTTRTLTTREKMAMGDGRLDDAALRDVLLEHARRYVGFDMNAEARDAVTVISAVMFGAVMGSGVVPFERAHAEAAIRESGKGVDASLAGFARGFDRVASSSLPHPLPSPPNGSSPFKGEVGRGMGSVAVARNPHPLPNPPLEGEGASWPAEVRAFVLRPDANGSSPFPHPLPGPPLEGEGASWPAEASAFVPRLDANGSSPFKGEVGRGMGSAVARGNPQPLPDPPLEGEGASWPAEVRAFVEEGIRRLTAYQDSRYAALYTERVRRVLALDRAPGFASTNETARFLALWMAFDDIVRVADEKTRPARHARMRAEVQARDGDLVTVQDYFKPRVAELAGALPPAWSKRLLAWDARRVRRGKASFAMPLALRSDSRIGHAMLRLVASLKRFRRAGTRYATEQAAIEHWLAAIERTSRAGAAAALAMARCGRLIKGYGDTHARSHENLARIVDTLGTDAAVATHGAALAAAIDAARDAALADPDGRVLDREIARHGAPARPPVVKPLVFVRPRPG